LFPGDRASKPIYKEKELVLAAVHPLSKVKKVKLAKAVQWCQ
jgi:hypothetical protein